MSKDNGTCMNCGHDVYQDEYGDWYHMDGIAACPSTTYASPELP